MKILVFFIGLFFSIETVFSQDVKIAEPEFIGVVLYVNDTIGTGVKLEQQTAFVTTKSNAASYVPFARVVAGKAKSKNAVNGSSSPVKIDKREKIRFIIKAANNSTDPTTIINIFKLTREKDQRTIELASAGTFGGVKTGDIEYIPFNGKKYGNSSYLIEIDAMEQGEYAITLAERRDLFHLFCIE
ncbi:MAG: hypothetical protein LBV74_15780 [Tannerella sp.]|nr:hypothetical protein [Tannerella sp.]